MRRQNVRTLSLVVCTFTYLLIGAAVFDALESENEANRWKVIKHVRDTLLAKYNISYKDFKVIEAVIIQNQPHKAGHQWEFAGALYFVTVVVAMIGYGHSTPKTIAGKAFCICYAVAGIPLGMVMFQSIGERLNKFTSIIIKKMKKVFGFNNTEATDVNQLMVTGTLSSIVMTVGAAVFSRYEGWNYIDSFYYCFITLTTIGFGDFVALQKDGALTTKPGYVAISLVFILFGLTVLASSINLLVLRFMTMNTEDIKAGDLEMQDASQSVMTLDGDLIAINGKLLAAADHLTGGSGGSTPRRTNPGGVGGSLSSVATVCSCNCYPKPHYSPPNHRQRSPSQLLSETLPTDGVGLKFIPFKGQTTFRVPVQSPTMTPFVKIKRASV